VLFLLFLITSIGCRIGLQDDYALIPTVSGNSSISGTITKSISPSMRANGQPAQNAKVWLEQRPDLFAFTDAEGEYVITGIPAGTFKIVAKLSQGTTIFKIRSLDTIVRPNDNSNSDLTMVEARNLIKGTLKNEDDSILTPGTKLYLWGEVFEVKENGSFETPPLPDFQTIAEATNEIILNFGFPNQTKLPVTFGNGGQAQFIEIYVPATPARAEQLPRASLININAAQNIDGVIPKSECTIRAIIYPENPQKIEWSAERGKLGQTTIISSTQQERTWTAPDEAGIATITISVTNSDKTVKASVQINVKGLPTYTVSYSGNGNNSGEVPVDKQSYLTGTQAIIASNSGNLVKTGFTFSGWNTKADGTGRNYLPGEALQIGSQNLTLYAKWIAENIQTYSVSYFANGSTTGTAPTDANKYVAGSTVTVKTNSGNLVKTGFTFSGWNTKADGTGTTYAIGATFAIGSADISLYAKWVAETVVNYTVTFNENGGAAAVNPDKIVVKSGDAVASMPTEPNKNGHTFSGWNTKADGTGTAFTGSTIVTADITVYAIYSINKFTLNYVAGQNGSITGSTTQIIGYGSSGSEVTAVPATGYKFTAWSDGKTDNPRTDANVMANLDVSASFSAINADVNANNKFAFSENAGWINFSTDHGKATAKLGENGYLSGFAWGENIGWIKLSASSATAPFANNSSSNWGINIASNGSLSGFAWSENSGWINFGVNNGNASIDQQTGELSGFVWGENIGWIKLSGSAYKVQFQL
jgi:uncharacterized repeat protein (TIGR02543 family)